MGAQTSTEYDEIIDVDGEEFAEVKGSGGNYPPTHDFDEDGDLVAIYGGSVTKDVKGDSRTIHHFDDGSVYDDDAGDKAGQPRGVDVWGAAILDDRLSKVEVGDKVKVVKTGKKLGRAWEFKVYVARSALAR